MAGGKTLELSIKIAGKVDKSLSAAINTAQSHVGSLTSTLSRIGTIGLAGMSALSAGALATIGTCTQAAADFEAPMANVVKYVSGLADKTGAISDALAVDAEGNVLNGKTYAENYTLMKNALLDLSTQIPMTAQDLTELAAAAGQSGYNIAELITYDDKGNIGGFLKDAAIMGTAMDVSAGQAGDWAAKWEKAFNMDHSEIMVLADQINYLGANSATTAAEIAQAVNDAASLGQIAGVDASTTAALADAMLATGVSSGRVGTSLKRTYTNLMKGTSASKAMKDMWEELGLTADGVAKSMTQDSIGTMQAVFNAINDLPQERQVAAISTLFGQWALEGDAKVVGNLDVFTNALRMVSDPALYAGSMQREFIIKASTAQAVDTMMGNAVEALKIDFGSAFLPAKKQLSLAMIDLMNTLRTSTPELQHLAETLAGIAEKGVNALAEAIPRALPYIQRALDYVANNGPQVVSILGKLAALFVGMKFAPAVGELLGGVGSLAGSLLFGSSGVPAPSAGIGLASILGLGGAAASGGQARRPGGLAGIVGSLFRGGQTAAGSAAAVLNVGRQAAGMSGGGFLSRLSAGAAGIFAGMQNLGGINSRRINRRNAAWTNITRTVNNVLNNGPLGVLLNAAANSGPGRYIGGIGASFRNLASTSIGGGLINAARGTGSTVLQILGGIAGPQGLGLTGMASGAAGFLQRGAGAVAGKVGAVGSAVLNSAPAQAIGRFGSLVVNSAPAQGIGRFASNVAPLARAAPGAIGSFMGAGAGLLGSIWGPAASGFGSLLAGAVPVVAAISGIIAVVSILGDHLEDLRPIIENVFGAKGVQVFDTFLNGLQNVKTFIMGLFSDGGVAAAFGSLHQAIMSVLPGIRTAITDFFTNTFGPEAGARAAVVFDGIVNAIQSLGTQAAPVFNAVVTVLQSVMGIVGQIVNFATTTVKPIIQDIFSFITVTVLPVIVQTITAAAPIIAGIITSLGTAVMTGMQIIGTAIQAVLPIIETIITVLLNVGSVVIPAVLAGFEAFSTGISNVMSAIQGIFQGLINFITGVFTGNWSQAWEGIKQIVVNAFNGLVNLVKTPINAAISFINGAINRINGIHVSIPEWVPVFGGKSFDMNIPTIPTMAKGGFTSGVSIAGEAGTEAVISFQSGERQANIETWIQAGRLLGVTGGQAASAAGQNIQNYFTARGTPVYYLAENAGSYAAQPPAIPPYRPTANAESQTDRAMPWDAWYYSFGSGGLAMLSADTERNTAVQVPAFAKGGFTSGVSIAGEAGTEAVISFQSGVRDANITTWQKAGRMLGVNAEQAATAAGTPLSESSYSGGAVQSAAIDATRNTAAPLPRLAQGGFTNGASIAGEAGTEAVISFQSGVRDANITTWQKAGRMLGVNANQTATTTAQNIQYFAGDRAVELAAIDATRSAGVEMPEVDRDTPPPGTKDSGGGSGGSPTFNFNITIQGDANEQTVNRMKKELRSEFEAMYKNMVRRHERMAY